MTILVGVRCQDGVVIGTDSSATFVAGQIRTIEQPVKKISIIADRIIVAGTGEIGMGQRFCEEVQEAWTQKEFTGSAIRTATGLSARARKNFSATSAPTGAYGALVAFPVERKLELCEFSVANFQPEVKTDDLWYGSMGSGQGIADPCLGFIRQAFWNDGMPTCKEGIFAVVWTLEQAIRLNPGGINAPKQVAVLSIDGRNPIARLLNDAEIAEHDGNVNGAIDALRAYRESLHRAAEPADAPQLPQPPAAS